MKLALLFLGCAVMLSHQQRNFYTHNKGGPTWPFQTDHRNLVIDEDTAEDFSEFLIARKAYYASQQTRPFSQTRLRNPFNEPLLSHSPHNEQIGEPNFVKSPSSLFRTNMDNSEEAAIQPNNEFAKPVYRPPSWSSIFGLSPFDARTDEDRARYFFNYFSSVGSSSDNANPFMKTIYYFTTATAISCSFISCLPASYFKAGKSTVPCRRKKRNDQPELENDDQIIQLAPTLPEKIESSELASQDAFARLNSESNIFELRSSKEDASVNENQHYLKINPTRSKRLFYNYFVYSTTLTTYSISTRTTTLTLSNIVDKDKLQCRPSNVVVCQ